MKTTIQELVEQYIAVLTNYLAGGGQAVLQDANELGQKAVDDEVSVLEMTAIHQEALATLLLGVSTPKQQAEIARRAAIFFTESLLPFEMDRNGLQEVVTETQDVTQHKQAEIEIIQRNRKLLDLQSTGSAISFSLDPHRVLNTVVKEMTYLLEVEGGLIAEWNQVANSIFVLAEHRPDDWKKQGTVGKILSLTDDPLTKGVLVERQARQMIIDQPEIGLAEKAYMQETKVNTMLMLPMIFQGRVVGLAKMEDRKKCNFTKQEISLAQLLANQAAGAIENVRLYNEVHQRVDELAVLSMISHTINSTLDLQEILTTITDLATRLFGVAATSVVIHDEANGVLRYTATSGEGSDFVRGKRLSPGQGIMGWVVRHGEPAVVPDVSEDQRFLAKFDQKSGFTTRSMLCVPLQTKGETIGAIAVMNKEGGLFDQEDLRILNLLAASAAIAIDNARLYNQAQEEIVERKRAEEALQESIRKSKLAYEQLTIYAQELTEEITERKRAEAALSEERALLAQRVEERTAELSAANVELQASLHLNTKFSQAFAQHLEALEILHDTGLRLMHSLDTDTVLNLISQTALELIPEAAGCLIHFLSNEENEVLPVVFSSENATKMVYPNLGIREIITQVVENQETVYVPDVVTDPRHPWPELSEIRSLLVIPLIEEPVSLGTLGVYSSEVDVFSEEHRHILSILANQAAVAIMKARFFRERELAKEREKQKIHNLFQCYVNPAVVQRLVDGRENLVLGGKRQDVMVLFADIRGFTTFSENLAPEKLVEVLNQYLALSVEAILAEEGTLDKFMGDAVMALFNTPLLQPDCTLRAIRAALAMQQAIANYNVEKGNRHSLSFGIGIHFGQAVVGNIGTTQQMNYTAIGDTVNLAKRLQENAKGGQILLSQIVYEAVQDVVIAENLGPLVVKGRAAAVKAYGLIGLR